MSSILVLDQAAVSALAADLLARADADCFRGELGDLLAGATPGRGGDDEITLFDSLGLAVEELAATRVAWQVAGERGLGVRLPWTQMEGPTR